MVGWSRFAIVLTTALWTAFQRASIAVAIVALGAAAYCFLSAARYRQPAVRR
jgi:hypothetical protein